MSARFSDEEMKVIRQIMSFVHMNKSQFVRSAVRMGTVSVIEYYVATSPKSPVVKAIKPLLKKIKEAGAIDFKQIEQDAVALEAKLSPKDGVS